VGGPLSPLEARQTQELTAEMRRVTRATLIAFLPRGLPGGLCRCGIPVRGIPHPAFFGLLTAMISFVPGVGHQPVWGPAAVSLWVGGRPGAPSARALTAPGGGRRGASGKPLLMRARCRWHTGLIFLSLLGGLRCSGFPASCRPLDSSPSLAMVRSMSAISAPQRHERCARSTLVERPSERSRSQARRRPAMTEAPSRAGPSAVSWPSRRLGVGRPRSRDRPASRNCCLRTCPRARGPGADQARRRDGTVLVVCSRSTVPPA